ncbi:unnamed protein product, partial [Closterium sp. NIES-54]
IAGGRRDAVKVGVGVNLMPTREQQAKEVQPTLVKPAKEAPAMQQLTGELAAANPTKEQSATGQSAGKPTAGEKSAGTSTSGRIRRPTNFYVPAAFTTVYDEVDDNLLYDDAEEDEELPELDVDMHADPEHRWDISTMTVKEALASWKGKAVKATMDEEIRVKMLYSLLCVGYNGVAHKGGWDSESEGDGFGGAVPGGTEPGGC